MPDAPATDDILTLRVTLLARDGACQEEEMRIGHKALRSQRVRDSWAMEAGKATGKLLDQELGQADEP